MHGWMDGRFEVCGRCSSSYVQRSMVDSLSNLPRGKIYSAQSGPGAAVESTVQRVQLEAGTGTQKGVVNLVKKQVADHGISALCDNHPKPF